jgi:hypothetical protein
MKTKFLTSTLLSVLLLTTTVVADTKKVCTGRKCFIDISKFSSIKGNKFKTKKSTFKLKKLKAKKSLYDNIEMLSLDKSKYVQQKNEKLTPIPSNEMETIILAPEKYIMTASEIKEYESEYIKLALPTDDINKKIMKKAKALPKSDFYCKNNKKPVYRDASNSYECA